MPDYTPTTPEAEERRRRGLEWFDYVNHQPLPGVANAYTMGIADFVFSEMWSRPGLTMKERRFITLCCVGASDSHVPIQSHVYAALKSGDVSEDEMHEFILHFAVYCGWPKASMMLKTTMEALARIRDEGGPAPREQPPLLGE